MLHTDGSKYSPWHSTQNFTSQQHLNIWCEERHEDKSGEKEQGNQEDAFMSIAFRHETVEDSSQDSANSRRITETGLPGRSKLIAHTGVEVSVSNISHILECIYFFANCL